MTQMKGKNTQYFFVNLRRSPLERRKLGEKIPVAFVTSGTKVPEIGDKSEDTVFWETMCVNVHEI
jgi:hypothetical protein